MTTRLLQSVAFVALLRPFVDLSLGQIAQQPPDLTTLIASISQMASASLGIESDGQKLAEQIQRHGASAIPYLLPLLEHPRPGVRELAAYILRDQPGLTEVHLDALIAARRRGTGWIPAGIARSGTPRAVQFLIEDLRARPERQGPVTFALAMLGERAAPGLADLLKDQKAPRELVQSICEVFDEMQAKAKPAVQPLLAIATQSGLNVDQRIDAVRAWQPLERSATSGTSTGLRR